MTETTPRQTVVGRVRDVPGGVAVEIGPFDLEPGETTVAVEFDRPLPIPLSVAFPDPERRADIQRTVVALFETEEERFDELLRIAGLDPATDLVGQGFAGVEFDGTPERPLDMRGWDLSGADMRDAVIGHVIADATTRLAGTRLDGISGPGAALLLALAGEG